LRTILTILSLLVLTAPAGAAPEITAEDFLDAVKALASDEMEGREAGAEGARLAAAWIAGRFRAMGLGPAGSEGSFLQPVPIPSVRPAKTCCLTIGKHTYVPNVHFVPFGFSAEGKVSGPVVFAGYGITAPRLKWDDYADVDAKGKVVLLFRHEPGEGTPRGAAFRRAGHSSFDRKVRNAAAHGAKAVVIVNDPIHHEKDVLPGRVPGRRAPIPAVFAKREVVAEALGVPVEKLAGIQRLLDAGARPAGTRPGAEISLIVKFDRTPLPCANVAALLPGRDPDLAEETIVVGAHYDHLGRGSFGSRTGGGQIHNGADDNASGVAAVLEVAERLAADPERPRRSILFLLFTGEEKGLHGSRHYVKKPLRPLADTVAMINLDMVGRMKNRSLFIGGVGTSPVFPAILKPLVAELRLAARFGQGGAAPSDNTPFYRAGMPTLFLFTGIHPDYHRPGDDWEKVNADGGADVARLVARTVRTLADADARPPFVRAGRAYLGVQPGRGGPGALVARVMRGTPAGKAGLRNGDRIVRAADREITSWSDLREVLRKAKPGHALRLTVAREETTVEIELILGEQ
jgi:aminopeptidase YwaD